MAELLSEPQKNLALKHQLLQTNVVLPLTRTSLGCCLPLCIFEWKEYEMKVCYECDAIVNYLFDDARCIDCTRLTREEIEGNTSKEGE